jgi:hypothetical protein
VNNEVPDMRTRSRPGRSPRPADRRHRAPGSTLASLSLLAFLVPLALYFLARPRLHSDAAALALAAAVPAAAGAAIAARRRQVRPLGVLAVVGLGAALAATVLTGGSSLPLKLERPVATGAIGLALLASVAVRRPLLLSVLRLLARGDDARRTQLERAAANPATRRALTIISAVLGAGFLVEAAATAIAALTLSTGAYLVVSRLIRLGVIGTAMAVAVIIAARRRRQRASDHATAPDRPDPAVRQAWFGPRRLGVGWGRPQTWQARLVVAALVAVVVVLRLVFHVSILGR